MSTKSADAPVSPRLPRLITVAEVAVALGVSRQTVYNLVKRGALPKPLKFGCATRFREDEVLAAIDAARVRDEA